MIFDIITIGTATRDAFIKSKCFRLVSSPDFVAGEGLCLPAGAKIELDDIIFATGGGATNAAVTFSRQGFHTACICKIGNDISGREVLANLRSEHISTAFIVEDEKLKTAYSILILAGNGERTALVYRGASETFTPSDIHPVSLKAKWFYIAGSLPVKLLELIADKAVRSKTKLAFNPSQSEIKLGLEGLAGILKKTDVLIINREEAAKLTGLDYKREDKITKCLNENVMGLTVLTDGSKGALISNKKSVYQVGAFKDQKVIDRTGAGDAFGSGFVAGLMQGNDIEEASRLASANATSVIERINAKTGILTLADFKNNPRWHQNLNISKKAL